MKNSRGFTPISIIIGAVAILALAGGGYFAYRKLINQNAGQVFPAVNRSVSTSTNWDSLIPDIRNVLKSTFDDAVVEELAPLGIIKQSDVTGDGVPEALIGLGLGGAYMGYFAVMRIENGVPIVVQFRERDGKISPRMFVSGASITHGANVAMLPEKHAVYEGVWSRTGEKGAPFGDFTDCTVTAYEWDSGTEIFDYSEDLGNSLRSEFCGEVLRVESGWKTYRNEEYGFELKYPEAWFVEEKTNSTGLVAILNTQEYTEETLSAYYQKYPYAYQGQQEDKNKKVKDYKGQIYISIVRLEWMNQQCPSSASPGTYDNSYKSLTINSLSGRTCIRLVEGVFSPHIYIEAKKQDSIVEIKGGLKSEMRNESKEINDYITIQDECLNRISRYMRL